jgi:translocation and assembly module TamB
VSKKFLRWLAILLATFLLLGAFVVSPWGTRTALYVMQSTVPDLNIQYASGGLGSELKISRLRWQNEGIRVEVKGLSLDINWTCSMAFRLCLSDLNTEQLNVNVAARSAEQTPTEPLAKITLPIPVLLESVALQNISVDVKNALRVDLRAVNAKLSMFQTLKIEQLSVHDVNVSLVVYDSPQPQNTPLDIPQIANWQYQPADFSNISIPLALSARVFQVEGLNIMQGQQKLLELIKIASAFELSPLGIDVKQLTVVHPLGELQLNGTIDSNLQHKLDIELNIQDDEIFTEALKIKLHAEGSPQDANIELRSTGALSLQAMLQADFSSPKLPLTVDVNWQNFTWPQIQPSYSSKTGKLQINGDLQQYTLVLDSDIAGSDIPPIQLTARVQGNQQQISVTQLVAELLDGNINLSGVLNISDILDWQGDLDFSQLNPRLHWPGIIANIQGKVKHKLRYSGSNFSAEISELDASGTWQGYQLLAKGRAAYDEAAGFSIPLITVSSGDNALSLNAKLNPSREIEAAVTLKANDLSQLYPSLSGQSTFDTKISGTLEEPQMTLQGSGQRIKILGFKVDSFTSEGSLIWDQAKTVDIKTNIINSRINEQKIENVNISLKGSAARHLLSTEIQSDTLNLNSQIRGELLATSWSGIWDKGIFSFPGGHFTLQKADTKLLADWQQSHYQIAPNCWLDDSASFCIQQLSYKGALADFELSARHLPLMQFLSPYLPELYQVKTDASLDASLKGQWQGKGLPTGHLKAKFSPSSWHFKDQKTALQLDVFNTELSIVEQENNDKQDLLASVYFLAESFGSFRADAKIQASPGERPMQGKLDLDDLQLQAFHNFLPQLRELQGEVNGQLALDGTLASPTISGQVDLKDGLFAGALLPSRINQVNQTLIFKDTSATLTGPFQLGNGKGQINGVLDWSEQLSGDLRVNGSEMEIDYQNILRAKVSPDIHLGFSPKNVEVSGSLIIPYARIKVRELPPEALSPSDDVMLVNQAEPEASVQSKLALNLQIDVDPSRTNNVKLDAFGLTSDLQGSILLTQDSDILNAIGELNLANGRYRSYGQDLLIRKGQILFSGPIDSPTLDLEAVRDPLKTADEVTAGIRVVGGAEQPKVSIFSEPSMEQQENLSYLLRGQSLTSSNDSSGDTLLANALISFGMSKTENQLSNVGRKLGVDDLALDTSGQGNETKISVSGYVAPGVQLRYGVGVFDSASEVALRYQISSKLYLEAVSGLNNALDIYYQFNRYDSEAPEQ